MATKYKEGDLPAGWSCESVKTVSGGVRYIAIHRPRNGHVTIDIDGRCFRGGGTTTGYIASAHPAMYRGRGWRDALWSDAIEYLARVYPLGPSNDAPACVQVEIRAAELERMFHEGRGDDLGSALDIAMFIQEYNGWERARLGSSGRGVDHFEEPGYLARELATHDDRETRDADAWSWDVTRPVDGQYDEFLVYLHGEATAAIIAEQTRHDVDESVRRHADLPSAIETGRLPDDLSTLPVLDVATFEGRPKNVPYAEDQLPLPVVSDPVLPPLTDREAVSELIFAAMEHLDDTTRDDGLARAKLHRFEIEVSEEPTCNNDDSVYGCPVHDPNRETTDCVHPDEYVERDKVITECHRCGLMWPTLPGEVEKLGTGGWAASIVGGS